MCSSRLYHLGLCKYTLMLAQWKNCLMLHFSKHIPIVKRCMVICHSIVFWSSLFMKKSQMSFHCCFLICILFLLESLQIWFSALFFYYYFWVWAFVCLLSILDWSVSEKGFSYPAWSPLAFLDFWIDPSYSLLKHRVCKYICQPFSPISPLGFYLYVKTFDIIQQF